MTQRRYLLDESEIPTHWYNVAADLDSPAPPPLHPGTHEPIGPDALAPLFPTALIMQEVSTDRWVAIPDPVREALSMWRPTPLYRALGWERALGTDCRIFYKYEGVSPAGSHKVNTAVAQAWYNAQEGVTRLATETGAGQWGSSLAFAGSLYGLEVKVYMVRVSYDGKPYRRAMMEAWGASVLGSPSEDTEAGRTILKADPDSTGSLGIAISEAVEDAASRDDTKYALGSVLNHVLLHQTVIGQEAQKQLAIADAYPDVVIGCVGGGSNFAGIAFPFVADKAGGRDIRLVAAEPVSCPTLTRGHYGYDFGDSAGMTPLLPMHTLGHTFMPAPIHAGGLRYHGMAPLVSKLVHDGIIEPVAYAQNDCFAAGIRFARAEGIIPAPEATHALRAVEAEVDAARAAGEPRTILFNLSGHGHLELGAYQQYLNGELVDHALPQSDLDDAAAVIAAMPAIG